MTQQSALTLDQIYLFLSVVEAGSFSAAGRRLNRAQSAVSYGVANLEAQLGLKLFLRTGRRPELTPTGTRLLSDARRVVHAVQQLESRAAAATEGLELEVSVAVSALCPVGLLAALGQAFNAQFPTVALRVQTDIMDAVPGLVLNGACHLGISGPFALETPDLRRRFLTHIALVPVASAHHPFAEYTTPLSQADLHDALQIVITQRAQASDVARSVLSASTWRVADAATKHGLIRAGLGWGYLPLELVQADLDGGVLAQLVIESRAPGPMLVALSAITRSDAPPGPAGRWLLDELSSICSSCPEP